MNKVTGSPWEATVNPGDPVASKTKVYGGGVGVAAMGQANVVNVRAADADGNPYTVKPAGDIEYKCVFSTVGGSVPSGVADTTQSTVYYGDGVYSIYYTPPSHTQAYYVKVVVTANGVPADPAGHTVLVSAAATPSASPDTSATTTDTILRSRCRRLR